MILIAGGKGFIGSNLCKLFDGLDLGMYETADLKEGIDVCDIKDASAYSVIVLLAANLGQDMQMFQDNLAIYRWAARQRHAHIIYTSSAAVYGDNAEAHKENDLTPAPTFYGRSKLLGEQIISQACPNRTILRLANVYGNGDGNGAIDIFKRGGNKIYGDGEDVRDYVHVSVVAEAIKRIALNPAAYNKEIFNISSFMPVTTNEAYAKYAANEGLPPEHLPARGFDVKYSLLWNAKAKEAGLIDAN
jgi:nucleoside-diphosphate-sugar epimerase